MVIIIIIKFVGSSGSLDIIYIKERKERKGWGRKRGKEGRKKEEREGEREGGKSFNAQLKTRWKAKSIYGSLKNSLISYSLRDHITENLARDQNRNRRPN